MPNRMQVDHRQLQAAASRMTLNGDGKGGVKVKLIGKIKPSTDDGLHGDVRRAPRRARAVRSDRHGRRRRAQGRHPRVAEQVQVRLRVTLSREQSQKCTNHRRVAHFLSARGEVRRRGRRLAAASPRRGGIDLPVRMRAWDGSRSGPGRRARCWSSAIAAPCVGCCGRRAKWAWRVRMSPATSTSTATSPTVSAARGRCRPDAAARRSRLRDKAGAVVGRGEAGCHRAAAEAARIRGPAVRSAAHPGAGPRRDRTPLRPVQRLLRAAARRAHGVFVGVLHRTTGSRCTTRSPPSSTWSAASWN